MTQAIDRQRYTPGGAPARRRSLFDRLRHFPRTEPDTALWRTRSGEAYRVLEDARATIAQGWVQDTWFVRRPPTSRAGAQSPGPLDGPGRFAACLVGAVAHAALRHGPGDLLITAGPALDHLWDAWQETRGLGGAPVGGRAAPRELRMARVRDLTRWNDQPGRTREEVLGLLDRAAAHAIMAAVRGTEAR